MSEAPRTRDVWLRVLRCFEKHGVSLVAAGLVGVLGKAVSFVLLGRIGFFRTTLAASGGVARVVASVIGLEFAWGVLTATLVTAVALRALEPELVRGGALPARMLARLPRVYTSFAVPLLLVVGGILLFVVPGIFLLVRYALRYALTLPAVLAEDRPVLAAFERSASLAAPHGPLALRTFALPVMLSPLVSLLGRVPGVVAAHRVGLSSGSTFDVVVAGIAALVELVFALLTWTTVAAAWDALVERAPLDADASARVFG